MIRPTAAAVWLFGIGIPLNLLFLAVDTAWWTVGLAVLATSIVLLFADHLLAMRPADLRLEAQLPAKLEIGVADRLEIAIQGGGRRRPGTLDFILDTGSLTEPHAWMPVVMPVEGAAHTAPTVIARQRGMIETIGVWLRWRGPFGLCWRDHHQTLAQEIPVLPDAGAARRIGIQLKNRNSLIGQRSQRLKGVGSEFDSIREHAAGMDSRAIDWKHSARHLKLLSRDYQAERNQRIVTAIDCGYLMREPLSGLPRLDHAIRAALAMAYTALAAGDRVGLYGLAATPGLYCAPAAGLNAFPRLKRETASLSYHGEETNFALGLAHLGVRLKQRALVVLLTDFIDTASADLMVESLGRMARRHLVLFVALADPNLKVVAERLPGSVDDVAQSVIAGGLLRERRLVIEELQRRGVHCLDTEPGRLVGSLIERYLDIKRLELI